MTADPSFVPFLKLTLSNDSVVDCLVLLEITCQPSPVTRSCNDWMVAARRPTSAGRAEPFAGGPTTGGAIAGLISSHPAAVKMAALPSAAAAQPRNAPRRGVTRGASGTRGGSCVTAKAPLGAG